MVSTHPLISKSSSRFNNYTKSTYYNWYYRHFHIQHFFSNSLAWSTYFSFFLLSFKFTLRSGRAAISTIKQVLFFLDYSISQVVWPRLNDPFVFQNPRGVCPPHSPRRILGCVYTIGSYGQILIFYTFPSRWPSSPSHSYSCMFSVLVCCIHLLGEWSFRLYHHITYNCYFIASHLFLLGNHHHHHVVRLARISQTLSLYVSQSFIASGRSSGLHPVSSHSCCMNVRAGRPAFDWPYAGVHRSTSLTISSLLLQQCTWI